MLMAISARSPVLLIRRPATGAPAAVASVEMVTPNEIEVRLHPNAC